MKSFQQEKAGYLKVTESASRKLTGKRKSTTLDSHRDKKIKTISNESHIPHLVAPSSDDQYDSSVRLECLYAYYLQYKRLLYNMDSRFAAAQLASKNELNIGYEAVKEQEAKMKAKELEEEAKENGIVKYFSRLKEVLNKIDEKLEQDGEIDYLKGLLNDLLIELKDIKIPASSIHEDIKILTKCRELIQDIIDS
ncbi:hypothetical protein G6F43_010460 [Rhizopus delemar]|nr:hypothetical protein G6F43_010460 [Rhizopus delemar]